MAVQVSRRSRKPYPPLSPPGAPRREEETRCTITETERLCSMRKSGRRPSVYLAGQIPPYPLFIYSKGQLQTRAFCLIAASSLARLEKMPGWGFEEKNAETKMKSGNNWVWRTRVLGTSCQRHDGFGSVAPGGTPMGRHLRIKGALSRPITHSSLRGNTNI